MHAAASNHPKGSALPLCIGFAFVMVWAAAPRSSAETRTLPADADTFISEHFLGPNGAGGNIISGTQGPLSGGTRNRGLIRFDLSTLPPGAKVTAASLEMTVVRSPDSAGPNSFELHRVFRLWSEGQSTWTLRLAPDQNWGAPGAAAGIDYAGTVSSSTVVSGLASYTFDSTPEMVADVTSWITNSSSNQGWLLITDDESISPSARRFASREGASGPQLILELESPLRIDSAGISGGEFCLRFEGKAGKSYVVERRARLDSGSWTQLTVLPPRGADGPVTVCDMDLVAGSMFYRVQEW